MAKKSSPLKGADPVLVKGAYDAAGNQVYQHWVQKQHESLMSIANGIMKWDPLKAARKMANSGGALSNAQMKDIRNKLEEDKKKYLEAEKAEQEALKKDAQALQQSGGELKQLRDTLGVSMENGDISQAFLRTPQGQELLELMKDDPTLTKLECPEGIEDCENKGNYGVMMKDWELINAATEDSSRLMQTITSLEKQNEDGVHDNAIASLKIQLEANQTLLDSDPRVWRSVSELDASIQYVDTSTKNVLEATRSKYYDQGINTLPEDDIPFNEKQALQTIQTTIIGKGDLQSMIFDQMIPGRTFYSDLVSHIKGDEVEGGRTWRDFGVTDEMMESALADGIVTDDEAKIVADALVSNEKIVKTEMEEYLMSYMKTNHQLGLDSRRLPKDENINESEDEVFVENESGENEEQTNEEIIEQEVEDVDEDDDEYEPQSVNTDYS